MGAVPKVWVFSADVGTLNPRPHNHQPRTVAAPHTEFTGLGFRVYGLGFRVWGLGQSLIGCGPEECFQDQGTKQEGYK